MYLIFSSDWPLVADVLLILVATFQLLQCNQWCKLILITRVVMALYNCFCMIQGNNIEIIVAEYYSSCNGPLIGFNKKYWSFYLNLIQYLPNYMYSWLWINRFTLINYMLHFGCEIMHLLNDDSFLMIFKNVKGKHLYLSKS